jgi:hypothetical protein
VQRKNKLEISQKVFFFIFFFIISTPTFFLFILFFVGSLECQLMRCLQPVALYFYFLLFSWWHTGLLLHACLFRFFWLFFSFCVQLSLQVFGNLFLCSFFFIHGLDLGSVCQLFGLRKVVIWHCSVQTENVEHIEKRSPNVKKEGNNLRYRKRCSGAQ